MEESFAIKQHLFNSILLPLLDDKNLSNISSSDYAYFLDSSFFAWSNNIGKNEIKKVKLFEKIIELLYKDYENDLLDLLSIITDYSYSSRETINISHENWKNSKKDTNNLKKLKSGMSLYKDLFESEFRIWSSFLYLYAKKVLKKKEALDLNNEELINLPSGKKLFLINQIKIQLPEGNIVDLIDGFESRLRNSGEGHLSYDFTDNDTVILKHINDRNGKEKWREELTIKDLNIWIEKCRKTIWVFEIGLKIFLNNNTELYKKIPNLPAKNKRALFEYSKNFAESSFLHLDEISYDDKNKTMSIKIRPKIKPSGTPGELYTSGGGKFNIIRIGKKTKYSHQAIRLVQYIISNIKEIPEIKILCCDENKKLLNSATLQISELLKLKKFGKKYMPIASNGDFPEREICMYVEMPVPSFIPIELFKKKLIEEGSEIIE